MALKNNLKNRKNPAKHSILDGLTYKKLGIVTLIGLPPLYLFVLLKQYVVNVPFWDQWEFVTIIQKSNEGDLGAADFFAQHNEHRLVFPRIFMYMLAKISHWNVNYEVAFSFILALISFVFLAQILRKTLDSRRMYYAGLIVLSLVFFSPIQWENWLWGWQIQWFLNVLGVIVSVWALVVWRTSPSKKLILAAAACTLATYSLGSGMFAWLICLPIVFIDKNLKKHALKWIGAAVLIIGVNYINYHSIAGHTSSKSIIARPDIFLHYITVYVTRPVNFDFFLAPLTGALLIISTLLIGYSIIRWHRKQLYTTLLPWLCFAAYGILAALSTAVSRLSLGVEQAYSNRYITLSNFILIALIVVLIKVIEVSSEKRMTEKFIKAFSIVALSMIVLLVGLNYIKGKEQMANQSAHLVKVKNCADYAVSASDDCLLKLYPDKDIVWVRLQYLRSIHWGGL